MKIDECKKQLPDGWELHTMQFTNRVCGREEWGVALRNKATNRRVAYLVSDDKTDKNVTEEEALAWAFPKLLDMIS